MNRQFAIGFGIAIVLGFVSGELAIRGWEGGRANTLTRPGWSGGRGGRFGLQPTSVSNPADTAVERAMPRGNGWRNQPCNSGASAACNRGSCSEALQGRRWLARV